MLSILVFTLIALLAIAILGCKQSEPKTQTETASSAPQFDITIPTRFSLYETWDVVEDTGTPVEFAVCDIPFTFDGTLNKLKVDLKK